MNEFSTARELMPVLGYKIWQKFEEALHRVQKSCESTQKPVEEHFFPAPGKTPTELGGRPKKDFFLTRYACYLIAQNDDPQKLQNT